MAIVCVGVDLAKNVFAIHGVDDVGKAVERMGATSGATRPATRGVQQSAAVFDRRESRRSVPVGFRVSKMNCPRSSR
jgi:hypothetical protein